MGVVPRTEAVRPHSPVAARYTSVWIFESLTTNEPMPRPEPKSNVFNRTSLDFGGVFCHSLFFMPPRRLMHGIPTRPTGLTSLDVGILDAAKQPSPAQRT